MSVCISVQDVKKTFRSGFLRKRTDVLRGVSFDVREQEIFGFLGPNGAGKTTTIKILMGLIFPTSGRASILGQDVREVGFRREIGFLPDNPYFYSYLTGEEFLHFYGQLFSLDRATRRRKIDDLLSLVDLQHARKLALRKYSKGMLQRIGLAQALINDPRLVIMDEPMTGLDPVGRKQMRDVILRLRSEGKTVFFSTHILSDAEMICDRVAIMVKGQIRGQGLLTDLLRPEVRGMEVCFRNPQARGLEEIERQFGAITVRGEDVYLICQQSQSDQLVRQLVNHSMTIVSMVPHRDSLEQLFLSEIR